MWLMKAFTYINMCIDYKALNKTTIKHIYPLSEIGDSLLETAISQVVH